jgi:drug/metabolite transporter (DMT)-like permease
LHRGALAALGAALLETPTSAGLAAAAVDIAYVGLLSSALTFTLLTVAMQHTPPSEPPSSSARKPCSRRWPPT